MTGQYAAGAVAGAAVPGYADELGGPSDVETFVALEAFIDTERWQSGLISATGEPKPSFDAFRDSLAQLVG